MLNSNLKWEPTEINKDANNKSTSGGKFVGRYPLNKDRKNYDYLKVCAKEYANHRIWWWRYRTEDAEDRNLKPKVGHSLSSYATIRITGVNSVGWGEDSLNAIEAAMGKHSRFYCKRCWKKLFNKWPKVLLVLLVKQQKIFWRWRRY